MRSGLVEAKIDMPQRSERGHCDMAFVVLALVILLVVFIVLGNVICASRFVCVPFCCFGVML